MGGLQRQRGLHCRPAIMFVGKAASLACRPWRFQGLPGVHEAGLGRRNARPCQAARQPGARVGGGDDGIDRSEERRVGEEGRSRWSPDHLKKKKKNTSELYSAAQNITPN